MKSLSVVEIARKLVGFPTVSQQHSTVEISDWIANYLERVGFAVELFPYFSESGGKKLKKVNLLAIKGGKQELPRLAFAGHMDTVPNGKQFKEPWNLRCDEGRGLFYGLGIADMKVFLALAMKVGAELSPGEQKHPFALCFTSDEEVGCLGTKKLFEQRRWAKISDYVVIGEPTSFTPVYLHKGYIYLWLSVEVVNSKGRDNPVHSSNPRSTTNVVEQVLPVVVGALRDFRKRLEQIEDARFEFPHPSMNIGGELAIGRSRGGKQVPDKVAKNIIPLGFTMSIELRPLPGQDLLDLQKLIAEEVKGVVAHIRPQGPNERIEVKVEFVRAPTLPMETNRDSPIVQAVARISGKSPAAVSFNTEGGLFNRSGSDAVVWGPAAIAQAHTDNEFVPASCLSEAAVAKYSALVREFCCAKE
ncbi:MAG: M20/M25/M40 family metallo-hydrolase [Verrucomicrobiae bacterium]|nr:M20/M25/M40 family metallo-hydrolase [Verrucomicrobiae bacterium]